MLSEYIHDYVDAKKQGDCVKMKQIEDDLKKLGMDRYTLMAIVKDIEKS